MTFAGEAKAEQTVQGATSMQTKWRKKFRCTHRGRMETSSQHHLTLQVYELLKWETVVKALEFPCPGQGFR